MNIKKLFSLIFWIGAVVALRRLITAAISGTMAETDLVSMRDAVVELDIGGGGSGWAAVESWANTVEPTRGTVPTSEEKTLDGMNHTGYGIAGNSTIKLTLFGTIGATHPLYNLYSQLGQIVDVRWSETGLPNDLRFYTNQGVLTQCDPPGSDANSNQSRKFTCTITGADIYMQVIPT